MDYRLVKGESGMNFKKSVVICLIAVLTIFLFCACEKDRNESSISVHKDGSVEQLIVESFDKEYYDIDELESMIEDEIKEFSGESKIELEKIKEKDDLVIVKMKFDSFETYNSFNNANNFFGTVKDALESDLLENVNFIDAKTGKKVKASKVTKNESLKVVAFKEDVACEVNEDVQYYSENLKLKKKKTCEAKNAPKEYGYLIY